MQFLVQVTSILVMLHFKIKFLDFVLIVLQAMTMAIDFVVIVFLDLTHKMVYCALKTSLPSNKNINFNKTNPFGNHNYTHKLDGFLTILNISCNSFNYFLRCLLRPYISLLFLLIIFISLLCISFKFYFYDLNFIYSFFSLFNSSLRLL